MKKLFLIVTLFSLALSETNLKEWERLGLSTTEWQLIRDNNMPIEKVESLLVIGVGISEYFERPWEGIGLTEEEWLHYRRKGLESLQVYYEVHPMVDQVPSEESIALETKLDYKRFQGFFLPGYCQWKADRKVLSVCQTSIAIGSITGTVVWCAKAKDAYPIPILFITTLLPDMIWSFLTR